MENQESAEKNTKQVDETKTPDIYSSLKSELDKKMSTVGWALFFIWIGIAFLANFDFGVGLFGIGILTLGMQVARLFAKLKLEGFWVVVGILFIIGGLFGMLESKIPLVPILLILAGLVLLILIVRGKR